MSRLAFRNYRWLMAVLAAFLLAAYIAGLFVDVTRDGSKYATVAKEMYETGDFIHLKIHGEPYDQKPPMLFWLSALSFYVFGVSNFAFKLPLLLLGFFGIYCTFRLGQSLYNRQTGLISAFLLATSQIYFLYYMDIHTDSVLQPFVTFALWQLYEFIKTRRNPHFILGFIGIGLAMLSKGPVGALVPAFAVTGHLVFTRQARRLLDIRWYLGVLLTLIVIIPALLGYYYQFGWDGIRFYLWSNNVGRVVATTMKGKIDYFFYFHNVLYQVLPWTILLLAAVFLDFRRLIVSKFRSKEFFLFSGIWFFFILVTLAKSKLPNYIFILIPLFSILTAKYIVVALYYPRKRLLYIFRWLQWVALVIALALLGAIVFWMFPFKSAGLWVVLLVALTFAGYFSLRKFPAAIRLLIPSAIVIVTINFFINFHVAPQIFSDQASIRAAIIFNEKAGPSDKLFNYNYDSYELFFYADRPVVNLYNDLGVIELLKHPGNWILTMGNVVNRLEGDFPKPEVIPLEHVWINKLRLSYLNPATREKSKDTLYLLRSAAQ